MEAIDAKDTEQDTAISKLVTLDTAQTITGLKHFTQFLGVKNTALDISGMSASAGNAVIANLDKNGLYVSGIGAGIYHSDVFDVSYLQLAANANANDVNGVIIEAQKKHKDNFKIAYAPSNRDHANLVEIATIDWVVQYHYFEPEAHVWQIGNNLQIFTMPLNTNPNTLKTITFNIPFSRPPMCFLHAWIEANDARTCNPILNSPTATTVNVGVTISGTLVPCFCTLLAIGYKG